MWNLLNIVRFGEEIVASTSLYGGTIDLFHDMEAFGIKTSVITDSGKFKYDVEKYPLMKDYKKFGKFAYYCWGVGILALILSAVL